jgi:hypothetical protein
MQNERDLRARVDVRDRGLRRLRTLTIGLAVGTGVLAGAFSGLAAHVAAGRKAIHTTLRPGPARVAAPARRDHVPPPPALPSLGSDVSAPPAAPAAPAPAVASSPPVVVSGGS